MEARNDAGYTNAEVDRYVASLSKPYRSSVGERALAVGLAIPFGIFLGLCCMVYVPVRLIDEALS